MHTGLGLPISAVPALLSWARRADTGPFSTIGLLDRLVYPNPEPLVTLAAIAGATARIRVQTEVLLAPLRDPVLLAKQAATLDRISAGRFTLGIGVGTRADDYRAAGVEFARRGRVLDDQLAILRRTWAEASTQALDTIGPAPRNVGGPEVLFGGFRPAALRRVARWGDGFLYAAPLEWAGQLARSVERYWQQQGRAGQPRLVAQVNVALGEEDLIAEAHAAIGDYYGPSQYTASVVERMLTTPRRIRSAISAFGELGFTETILYCWAADPAQVDQLAEAIA